VVSRRGQSFFRGQSTFFLVVISRRGRRGQLLWLVVLHSQSVVLIVVVSRHDHSFFVVSRLDHRGQSFFVFSRLGQSSRSVVLRGWCLNSMVVMHTYLLRHMAGENCGQCLDKCTGVGRTRVRGHETRPKTKPNVDYLLSYLLLFFIIIIKCLLT